MFKEIKRFFSCAGTRKMAGGPSHELAATSAGGNTSARRKAEDVETIKLRLVDQDFKIGEILSYTSLLFLLHRPFTDTPLGKLRDPFTPRRSTSTKKYPNGVTPEDEQKWLALIRDARDRGDII